MDGKHSHRQFRQQHHRRALPSWIRNLIDTSASYGHHHPRHNRLLQCRAGQSDRRRIRPFRLLHRRRSGRQRSGSVISNGASSNTIGGAAGNTISGNGVANVIFKTEQLEILSRAISSAPISPAMRRSTQSRRVGRHDQPLHWQQHWRHGQRDQERHLRNGASGVFIMTPRPEMSLWEITSAPTRREQRRGATSARASWSPDLAISSAEFRTGLAKCHFGNSADGIRIDGTGLSAAPSGTQCAAISSAFSAPVWRQCPTAARAWPSSMPSPHHRRQQPRRAVTSSPANAGEGVATSGDAEFSELRSSANLIGLAADSSAPVGNALAAWHPRRQFQLDRCAASGEGNTSQAIGGSGILLDRSNSNCGTLNVIRETSSAPRPRPILLSAISINGAQDTTIGGSAPGEANIPSRQRPLASSPTMPCATSFFANSSTSPPASGPCKLPSQLQPYRSSAWRRRPAARGSKDPSSAPPAQP